MGLSSPKIKKVLIFSQKAFLIFRETEPFLKKPPDPEKSEKPTLKKSLILREMELQSLLGGNLQRPENQIKKSTLKKFLIFY